MENNKQKKIVENIEKAIENIANKSSNLYFFIADTRNIPNAKMEYIYQLAYTLKEKHYNVCMVYQLDNEYSEKELSELKRKQKPIDESRQFIGIGDWLGEKYGKLKHINVSDGTWKVGPSDFLFIPEVFASLMKETYRRHLPCKRYVIMQNFNHITEFIPFGDQWASYGILDAIVPSKKQGDLLSSTFKYVNVNVLPPFIPEYFRKPITAKKLIVNVVAKNRHDAEHVIKLFYWKYGIFQFVPFRILNDITREKFAELMKEGAITVWLDKDSSFGYSALESIRCNSVTVGRAPEITPEWMEDENGDLIDNGFWLYDTNSIPDVLATVINKWLEDEIPENIYKRMDETNKKYTLDEWSNNVQTLIDNVFERRIKELKTFVNEINDLKTEEQ